MDGSWFKLTATADIPKLAFLGYLRTYPDVVIGTRVVTDAHNVPNFVALYFFRFHKTPRKEGGG